MRFTPLLALAFAALANLAFAQQPPQLPAVFYGTVSVDGAAVPEGTEVRAFVGGQDCSQDAARARREGDVSVYVVTVMHDSQRAGCGSPGASVTFRVGEREAGQRGAWQTGQQLLNLNAGRGEPLPLPSPTPETPLPAADQTATATAAARFTPLPAPSALPTDDIALPSRTAVATAATVSNDAAEREDGNSAGWLIGGLLVSILLAGGIAGWLLSRRR